MKHQMTEAERHAKALCKDCALREGFDEGYVIKFSSHPAKFKSSRTGEVVTLNTGYGIHRKDTDAYECDIVNGRPVPFDSYWEALATIKRRMYQRIH